MTYSIKFNNTCSDVQCPDCTSVHKPAVGLQIVKGDGYDIVCNSCAVKNASELSHAFAIMGQERYRHGGWNGWLDPAGEIGSTVDTQITGTAYPTAPHGHTAAEALKPSQHKTDVEWECYSVDGKGNGIGVLKKDITPEHRAELNAIADDQFSDDGRLYGVLQQLKHISEPKYAEQLNRAIIALEDRRDISEFTETEKLRAHCRDAHRLLMDRPSNLGDFVKQQLVQAHKTDDASLMKTALSAFNEMNGTPNIGYVNGEEVPY